MKETPQTYCPPKIAFHLEYILDADEIIKHVVKQKKSLFILWPEYIIATNKRLIFCIPEAFCSRFNSYEHLWEYVEKCTIVKKVASTVLLVHLKNKSQVETNYLPNEQAVLLYKFITKMVAT